MSAAHETTILPECVWVSWMAEISIRVCAAKAALQTMPAGTATAQEEKTHSSLSFSQKKQGAVLRNRPKMRHPERYNCISCASLGMERAGNPSSSCLQPECPLLSPPRDQAWGGCHIPQLCLPGCAWLLCSCDVSSSSVSLDHEYLVLVVCEPLLYTQAAV